MPRRSIVRPPLPPSSLPPNFIPPTKLFVPPTKPSKTMQRLTFAFTFLFAFSMLLGCGDTSGTPEPAADQDELAAWVSENPAPETTELVEE